MKTKLEMAHEWYMMQVRRNGGALVADAWKYADAMKAEADKRDKEEASQKRKAIREMLNADNTFLEKEGQHFEDVEWQPDWSQAPEGYDWFIVGGRSGKGFFCLIKPSIVRDHYWFVGEDCLSIEKHDYQGDWRESLRKRPN